MGAGLKDQTTPVLVLMVAPAGPANKRKPLRIVVDPDARPLAKGNLCGQHAGFNLHGATKVSADEVEIFSDKNLLIARGNVTLTTQTQRISADSLEFDLQTKLGTFRHASGNARIHGDDRRRAHRALLVAGVIDHELGARRHLADLGIDVDPHMISHPRTCYYVRMDEWDQEAAKWVQRKERGHERGWGPGAGARLQRHRTRGWREQLCAGRSSGW